MKDFVVICGILALVHAETLKDYANSQMENIVQGIEECADEMNIKTETMEELSKREVPKSYEGKCVIACLYKRKGMMDADGNIDPEMSLKQIESLINIDIDIYHKMITIGTICAKIEMSSDICLRAVDLVTCAIEEGGKVGITKELLGL